MCLSFSFHLNFFSSSFLLSNMKFHFFHIMTFLMLLIVATNGKTLPPQLYWKSMLPNSPMPKAITNLLHPSGYWSEEKATWVDVGKGGVDVGVRKGYNEGSGTDVNVGVGHSDSPFNYLYAASETQLHDKPNVALFFLEKDLHHGTKLNLLFPKTTSNNEAKFLPKEVANSIPFSSNKVEYILNKLNIKKGTKGAQIVKNTISECEEQGIKGEEKLCVTSLESMIDFTALKLGKNVEAISTQVNKESEFQEYTIAQGVKKLGEKNTAVVCHKENYPYAVFYCHKTDTTKVYSVPLEGVDGNRVNAIAVCHTDTSQWNPKHLAFQVLKVQPGTVPVCHFLPQEHVVWVSK